MAQYKVPQDVEAEDKLLGPFTFRQFVYLMIIGGLIGLGILFWQFFPPLIIVLIPPILLLGALALPLKKDQPMETYLSAVVSFYLKPHIRTWEPGEPESTIIITAPKKKEEQRTKDLDQDEAMHRLSFLADIIDTEGYAIKGVMPNTGIKDEVYAEASDTLDMFEDSTASSTSINQTLQNDASERRSQAISQMRAAIENNANQAKNTTITHNNRQIQPAIAPIANATQQPQTIPQPPALPQSETANMPIPNQEVQATPKATTIPQAIEFEDPLSDEIVKNNDTIIKPDSMIAEIESEKAEEAERQAKEEEQRKAEAEAKRQAEIKEVKEQTDPNIINLANNTDFSIETIANQAKRIKEKKDDEVYISLH